MSQSLQLFLGVGHFGVTKISRMTNIAERRSLESVDADPHSNGPGLGDEWWDGGRAEGKVEQRREDGGDSLRGGVSHPMQPGSCQLQCPFTFVAGELFFPLTHLLRRAHTHTCTHGHKVIQMDRRRQLHPPRWALSEGESDGGEPPVRRENSRTNFRLVAFQGTNHEVKPHGRNLGFTPL